jgi:nucleotide-binding universal stress UspA family protein
MGTHGKSGLDRFLLGSVAEKVTRNSHVPVMVVRGNGKE